MPRQKSGNAKPVFALRLRQEVINASSKIVDFRKRLEEAAEEMFSEWRSKNGP